MLDWVKGIFSREGPARPQPTSTPSADYYREQAQRGNPTRPGPQTPTSRDRRDPAMVRAQENSGPARQYTRPAPQRPAGPTPSADYYRQQAETYQRNKMRTFAPSATDQAFLQSRGWTVEHTPMEAPHEATTFANLVASPSHSYAMDADQIFALEQSAKNLPGYTAPEGTSAVQPFGNVGTREVEVAIEVGELSWEDYDALTPAQRAAIDMNTRLVEARNKDLNAGTRAREAGYDDRVEKMFGPGGGSRVYAPETMKFLESINYSAVGQDLDEYLSLERAIDMDELQGYQPTKPDEGGIVGLEVKESRLVGTGVGVQQVPGLSNYNEAKSALNIAALESDLVAKHQAEVDKAMQDAARVMWDFRSTFSEPGALTAENTPYGFGTAEMRGEPAGEMTMDIWTADALSALRNPQVPVAETLNQIETEMVTFEFTPEEVQNFYNIVDTVTMRDLQYGTVAGNEGGNSPKAIRAALGWE